MKQIQHLLHFIDFKNANVFLNILEIIYNNLIVLVV